MNVESNVDRQHVSRDRRQSWSEQVDVSHFRTGARAEVCEEISRPDLRAQSEALKVKPSCARNGNLCDIGLSLWVRPAAAQDIPLIHVHQRRGARRSTSHGRGVVVGQLPRNPALLVTASADERDRAPQTRPCGWPRAVACAGRRPSASCASPSPQRRCSHSGSNQV